ncbi:hypothetical protein ILT44_23240 [Microvirga sp. BT689]|nr:hypothetical protein [Microvirga arvi]MBM6583120.1 hypothetical protein [Microvirga arvi]
MTVNQPGAVIAAAAQIPFRFVRHRPSLTPTLSRTGEGDVLAGFLLL